MSAQFALGPGCCCSQKDADIQMIIGLLQRVGLGQFGNAIGVGNIAPTGPLATAGNGSDGLDVHRDPLYLQYVCKLVWADPGATTFTDTFTYDPNFADMSRVTTGPTVDAQGVGGGQWTAFTQTNIPAASPAPSVSPGYPSPANQDPYCVYPSTTPVGGYYYNHGTDGVTQDTTTLSADGLLLTITAPTYYDAGGWPHYGFTFTAQLSQPFTWAQYAAIVDSICLNGGATLQDGTLNPGKSYPLTDFPGINAKLRYFCEFPTPPDPAYINTLVVTRTRAGYQYRSQLPNSAFLGDFSFSGVLGLPCKAQLAVNTNGTLPFEILARYPLAAHGIGFTSPLAQYLPPNLAVPSPAGGAPGAPALSGQWICSIQTSVRSQAALNATSVAMIYDPAADTLTQHAISLGANGGVGEYIFTPQSVGGLGYLFALYSADSICTTMTQPLPGAIIANGTPFIGQTNIFLARGAQQTFYAGTFDKNGNWMRNRGGVWNLAAGGAGIGAITPACLVPAPDGLSAVFTAPAGAGEAWIQVTIPGLTFQPGILVIVN